MDGWTRYQQELLDQARQIYRLTPLSDATIKAYLSTPRHLFVQRYREHASKKWHEVNDTNLYEHLAALYADRPLTLFADDDDNVPSTISQPSFVLRMLDLLQFEPGQTVFELGAGSGWNAALIGQLVGPAGRVYSLEIIPEIAERAAATISTLGIGNVHIVAGDGGEGYADGAPYDRVTFTAGTYDVPGHFFDQIKENGLMLSVIKTEGGGDSLFLLRKVGGHFESEFSMTCGFVQMTGKYKLSSTEPAVLESHPEWDELQRREISRRPFWWGWGGKARQAFMMWETLGVRSFLGITEPWFRAFKVPKSSGGEEQQYFGLWDREGVSLVIAKDYELVSYGSTAAADRLLQDVHRWIDLGMPAAASFNLKVYRAGIPIEPRDNQWVVRR